jgi:hypothetical protein
MLQMWMLPFKCSFPVLRGLRVQHSSGRCRAETGGTGAAQSQHNTNTTCMQYWLGAACISHTAASRYWHGTCVGVQSLGGVDAAADGAPCKDLGLHGGRASHVAMLCHHEPLVLQHGVAHAAGLAGEALLLGVALQRDSIELPVSPCQNLVGTCRLSRGSSSRHHPSTAPPEYALQRCTR